MVTVVPAAEVVTACFASRPASSALTILLPRLPLVGQSLPSGRPTPSSETWMRTTPPLSRCTRVSTSPLSRPTKAWRKALVRISETSRPTRPAVVGVDDHLLGDDVDPDALAAVEVADRGGDAADVGAERHLVAEGRGDAGLAELLVEQLQRLDAPREHHVVVAGVGAARLQPDHADDHRQVVLHPVLDLGELQPHRREPALRDLDLAGALGAEEVGDAALVEDRRDRQAVEERRAVGAVVGDLDGDVLPGGDRPRGSRPRARARSSGPCRKRQLRPIVASIV